MRGSGKRRDGHSERPTCDCPFCRVPFSKTRKNPQCKIIRHLMMSVPNCVSDATGMSTTNLTYSSAHPTLQQSPAQPQFCTYPQSVRTQLLVASNWSSRGETGLLPALLSKNDPAYPGPPQLYITTNRIRVLRTGVLRVVGASHQVASHQVSSQKSCFESLTRGPSAVTITPGKQLITPGSLPLGVARALAVLPGQPPAEFEASVLTTMDSDEGR